MMTSVASLFSLCCFLVACTSDSGLVLSNVDQAGSAAPGSDDMATRSIVPKTGSYSGTQLDPRLSSTADCADEPLEPNDAPESAVELPPIDIDFPPLKLTMLAICPSGSGDRDYYKFNVPQSLTALVELSYDIKYGDLDLGVFAQDGKLLAGDGTAVGNGCVTVGLSSGTYYVGVGGANDVDANRYQLSVRFSSTARTCP